MARTDDNCWTGAAVGDYTQTVMPTGVDTQRYNPEVPLEQDQQYGRSTRLNELVDKLIKLRHTIEVSANFVNMFIESLRRLACVFGWNVNMLLPAKSHPFFL